MPAKPILDIAMSADANGIPRIAEALVGLGYIDRDTRRENRLRSNRNRHAEATRFDRRVR